jgi:hypothetical protein
MNVNAKSGEERLRFIKHKGHAIFLIDFTHCAAKELLVLLDLVRADIARHAPGSVLTLVEVAGAEIDKTIATRIKEVLVLDRPYVKRSAWVGTESLPQMFYEHFKTFSQRDLPTFKTREEAMEWLVQE